MRKGAVATLNCYKSVRVFFYQEKFNVKLEEDKLKEYLDEVNSYQQKHADAVSLNLRVFLVHLLNNH